MIAAVAAWLPVYWVWAMNIAYTLSLFRSVGGISRAWLDEAYRFFVRLHQDLWIFVPVATVYNILHEDHLMARLGDAGLLALWWWYRDWPDDNEWKKRGRKVLQKVTERAGRLVVVRA